MSFVNTCGTNSPTVRDGNLFCPGQYGSFWSICGSTQELVPSPAALPASRRCSRHKSKSAKVVVPDVKLFRRALHPSVDVERRRRRRADVPLELPLRVIVRHTCVLEIVFVGVRIEIKAPNIDVHENHVCTWTSSPIFPVNSVVHTDAVISTFGECVCVWMCMNCH